MVYAKWRRKKKWSHISVHIVGVLIDSPAACWRRWCNCNSGSSANSIGVQRGGAPDGSCSPRSASLTVSSLASTRLTHYTCRWMCEFCLRTARYIADHNHPTIHITEHFLLVLKKKVMCEYFAVFVLLGMTL